MMPGIHWLLSSPADTTAFFISDTIVWVLTDLLWCAGCIIFSILAAWLCFRLFNHIPAGWLCDYGEEPSPELLEQRVFFRPDGIAASLLIALVSIECYYQYGGTVLLLFCFFISLTLMLITISDLKYSIIPDQFTIALAVFCILASAYDLIFGAHTLHSQWWSPLAGAAIGGGIMLLMNLAGLVFYKKQGIGFGDVKLFAAVGLLVGFSGIIPMFLIALFLAFIHFITLMLRHKINPEVYLPLGPYICIASVLFLMFRSQIFYAINWYIGLFA